MTKETILNPTQVEILVCLFQNFNRKNCASKISRKISKGPNVVHTNLAKLNDLGLVRIDPLNGRDRYCNLTRKGKEAARWVIRIKEIMNDTTEKEEEENEDNRNVYKD